MSLVSETLRAVASSKGLVRGAPSVWVIAFVISLWSTAAVRAEPSAVPATEDQSDRRASLTNQDRVGPLAALLGYSYDTRDFTTLNITTFTGRLPYGFNIWGFADISSTQRAGSQRFDLVRHFVEYRLRWRAPSSARNFGLEAEYNDASGDDNSVVRGGITYNLMLPFFERSWLQLRLLPMQSRGRASQFSIIHNIQISPKLSLAGFSDMNTPWDGGPMRLIAESQLTFHLTRELGVGIEARYNGFEDANQDLRGLGLGLALVAQL